MSIGLLQSSVECKKAEIARQVQFPTRHVAATLALAVAGSFWGTAFFFGKIAFAEMSVSQDLTLRFVFGSLFLAPVLLKTHKRFTAPDFRLLMLAALFGVPVQLLIQFKGLELSTVSHASLMMGALPMLLALCSVIFLRERLRSVEWVALAASAMGAVLIALVHAGPQHGPQSSIAGDLLVLLSLFAGVAMMLITKRLTDIYDPLYVTASMLILGTIMLLLWLAISQTAHFHFSLRAWTAVAAQGVLATALAYPLWNWGLARVPASRAGVFLNMEPLVGTILGISLLHETLGRLAILGGVLILGSAVYFSTQRQ